MYLSFDEKLEILKDYLKNNNLKKGKMVHKGLDISFWLKELRTIYSNGIEDSNGIIIYNEKYISKNQISKLNDLGVSLDNYKYLNFDKNMSALNSYYKEHGYYPRSRQICYNDINIGKWMFLIKSILEKGHKKSDGSIVYKDYLITKQELDKLEEFRFLDIFEIDLSRWDFNYDLVCEYIEKYNTFPKQRDSYKNCDIGKWFIRQRTAYKNGSKRDDGSIIYNNIVLKKEQVEKLERIKIKDSFDKGASWEDKYNLLKEYVEKYKCFPGQGIIYKDYDIGSWLNTKKTIRNHGELKEDNFYHYKKLKCPKELIDKLDELGIDWKPGIKKDLWDNYYDLLKEYLKEYNRFPMTKEYYKNMNLGEWVLLNRIVYNNGVEISTNPLIIKYMSHKLTQDRIDKLNSINFNWVEKETYYNKKKIVNQDIMKAKRRYLLLRLKELEELNMKFETKEDIKKLNIQFTNLIFKKDK